MKLSTTGFGVTSLGTNKFIIYSLGAHHLEIVVEKTLRVLIDSTESVCSPYDASKEKKKDKYDIKR